MLLREYRGHLAHPAHLDLLDPLDPLELLVVKENRDQDLQAPLAPLVSQDMVDQDLKETKANQEASCQTQERSLLGHQDPPARPAPKEPQDLKDKEDFKVNRASRVCLGAQEVQEIQEVQEVQEVLIEPHLIGPALGPAAHPAHPDLQGQRATKGILAYLGHLESLELQEALDQSSLVLQDPQAFLVLQASRGNRASRAHTPLRPTSVSTSTITWSATDRLLFKDHQARLEPLGSLEPLLLWKTYPPVSSFTFSDQGPIS